MSSPANGILYEHSQLSTALPIQQFFLAAPSTYQMCSCHIEILYFYYFLNGAITRNGKT